MMKIRRSQAGFTLTEFLIVLSIVAIFAVLFMWQFQKHQARARDAGRKTDLEKIKIAFEDYYNDHNCYPDPDVLNNCNGDDLQPYLDSIPCDPHTDEPYRYLPAEEGQCKGYRLLTGLEDGSDAAISKLGCDTSCGCGYGIAYNYGVSSGVELASAACVPLPSPSPTLAPQASSSPGGPSPFPSGYVYACDPAGVCNNYQDPMASGCKAAYPNSDCNERCDIVSLRCKE